MSVAIAWPELKYLSDVNVTPGVGVDEYALTYDHDTAKFVLRAPFAGMLATGATVGATAQAQAFTLGVVSPFDAPAADSTTAWQVRKADKTTAVVTVDTTNGNVGIGTAAPGGKLHIVELGTTPDRGLILGQHNTGAHSALMTFKKSRGTLTSPSVVSTGDYTSAFVALNYDGSAYLANGNFGYKVLGTVGTGSVPGEWFFAASAANDIDPYSNNTVRMLIKSTGLVGIGTTTPATRLDIDAGALTMKEMTAPTGVADKAMLYTKDNGSGKTQLCCKLGDNVEIILATQA